MGKRQVRLGVTEKTNKRRNILGEKWRWGVQLSSRQEVCCVVREQEEAWGKEIESLVVNLMEIYQGVGGDWGGCRRRSDIVGGCYPELCGQLIQIQDVVL